MNIPWKCTDSDNQQYGRKREDLGDWFYEFKENKKRRVIKLHEYTIQEIESIISSYGYSLNPISKHFIFDIYEDKETVNWIIAECIFETED